MDDSQGRLLNVSLLAGSGAHRAYYARSFSAKSTSPTAQAPSRSSSCGPTKPKPPPPASP